MDRRRFQRKHVEAQAADGAFVSRNGWSAKTLRRVSTSINIIKSQELFYAMNMFVTARCGTVKFQSFRCWPR